MAKRYLLDFEKPLVELEKQIEQIKELARDSEVDVSQQLLQLETLAARRREEIFKSLTPAQKMQVARHPQRPSTLDFVQMFCDDWIELHGDRNGGDDMALIGGIGSINNRPVLRLGHQKGRDTKENVVRNFGMAKPGGYRKALRLMQHANRLSLPILTFIDTPGAYAGLKAEAQGQGEAIARNLREMFACFAEAMILEFEKCHTNFSWGRNNISLEKMEFIGAASLKHGFSAIGLDKQPKVLTV